MTNEEAEKKLKRMKPKNWTISLVFGNGLEKTKRYAVYLHASDDLPSRCGGVGQGSNWERAFKDLEKEMKRADFFN